MMNGRSELVLIFILIFADCFSSFYFEKLSLSHHRIRRSSDSVLYDHDQDSDNSSEHKRYHHESAHELPYVSTTLPVTVAATTPLTSYGVSPSTKHKEKWSPDQIYDSAEIVYDIQHKPLSKPVEINSYEGIPPLKERIFYPPQPEGYEEKISQHHSLDNEADARKENEANPSNEYNVPGSNESTFSLPSPPSQRKKNNWSDHRHRGSATTFRKSNKEHNHSYLKVSEPTDSGQGYESLPASYEAPTSIFKSSELSYKSSIFPTEKPKPTYEIPEYTGKESSINYVGHKDSNSPATAYGKPKQSHEQSSEYTEPAESYEIPDKIYKPSSITSEEQSSEVSSALYKKPKQSYKDPNSYRQFSDTPEEMVKSHQTTQQDFESPIESEEPKQSYETPILPFPTHDKPWHSYNHPKSSFYDPATTIPKSHHAPTYQSILASHNKHKLSLKGGKLKYDPPHTLLVPEQNYQPPETSHELYTTPHEKHEEPSSLYETFKQSSENYMHSIMEEHRSDKAFITPSRLKPMFKSSYEISVSPLPSSTHRLPSQYKVISTSYETSEESYLDRSNEYEEPKVSNFTAADLGKKVVLKENYGENSLEVNQAYGTELPVEYKIPMNLKDDPQLDYGTPTEKSTSTLSYKSPLRHTSEDALVPSLSYDGPKLEHPKMNLPATRIGYDTDIRSLLKDFTHEQQPIIIVDSRRSRRPFYSPPILPHRVLDPYDDGLRASGRRRRPFPRRRRPWYRRRFRPRLYRSIQGEDAFATEK